MMQEKVAIFSSGTPPSIPSAFQGHLGIFELKRVTIKDGL
jgi:hypothetical protein